LAALLHYPWWQLTTTHQFRRADFDPPPAVDSVLLHLARRATPLLPVSAQTTYWDFAAFRFERDPRAGQRSPQRFLSEFLQFQRGASRQQRRLVHGAYQRLQAQQAHLQKIHRTRTAQGWKRNTL